jgi:hypothetical protein
MTTEHSADDQFAATHVADPAETDAADTGSLFEVPDTPASIDPAYVSPAYSDPDFAARYGVRRAMSRTRKILLGVFGFVLLCGVVGYIAWEQANPATQATVISYIVNGSSISVTFEVDKAANQSVECTLQAEDLQGNVIGSANVLVPTGRAKEDMVYTVNTTGTPNTAVVSTCTANS